MILATIISVALNVILFGWLAMMYRSTSILTQEIIELEEKCGKYYMRLLGEASKRDV